MKMARRTLLVLTVCAFASETHAVLIDTVTVGNPGNPPDTRYDTTGYGSVNYAYNIGTFEVTAGQYTEFLNAVAATDTYTLYNPSMWTNSRGCKIERLGEEGHYTYSVATEWANRPVNYVSWADAARFSNWLHNGQPTGAQDLSTTEDGSYFLNGMMSGIDLAVVTRKSNATWVLPTEDEWYKAAYHQNDGVTNNYWDYPTTTDDTPSNLRLDPDPGNNANFRTSEGYTLGDPYWRTEVGEFENSDGPYGTFDQGGNVYEFNETVVNVTRRGLRGGAFTNYDGNMSASARSYALTTYEANMNGFRVAEVPEPATVAILLIGLLGAVRRR